MQHIHHNISINILRIELCKRFLLLPGMSHSVPVSWEVWTSGGNKSDSLNWFIAQAKDVLGMLLTWLELGLRVSALGFRVTYCMHYQLQSNAQP